MIDIVGEVIVSYGCNTYWSEMGLAVQFLFLRYKTFHARKDLFRDEDNSSGGFIFEEC